MAKSLIARLTQIGLTKTPDEIVAQLKSGGWTKGSDMLENVWKEWQDEDQRIAICYQNPNHLRDFTFNGQDYRAGSYSHSYVTSSLRNHWFILGDQYEHGVTLRPDGLYTFSGYR